MYTVITRLNRSHIKNDGTCAVYLFIRINGKKIRLSTGVCVLPENFDEQTGLIPKARSESDKSKNLILDQRRAAVNKILVKYKLSENELSPELFIKEYNNPTRRVDFYKFWEDEFNDYSNDIQPATRAQHRSVLKKLKEYKSTLTFSELDYDFIKNFARYCTKELKNKNSTILKQKKTIEFYINAAIRQKILDKNPFSGYKMIKNKPKIEFLQPFEHDKLVEFYQKGIYNNNVQKAVRHYLFCCYTGLRISDLRKAKKTDIVGNVLVFLAQKTKKHEKIIDITLNDVALMLIEDENSQNDYIFNVQSEPHERRMMVRAFDGIGVKPKKFHSSRHTFATNYLRAGGRVEVLQELLGHSDINTTMIYVHVIDEEKISSVKDMEKLWIHKSKRLHA